MRDPRNLEGLPRRTAEPKHEGSQTPTDDGVKREFDTGATRDTAEGKLAYDRFLSPRVLKRYCEYLESHRTQSDGTVREPDNWKKGIPLPVYRASLTRHVQEVNEQTNPDNGLSSFRLDDVDRLEETLSAVIFNAMGMLLEVLKTREEV